MYEQQGIDFIFKFTPPLCRSRFVCISVYLSEQLCIRGNVETILLQHKLFWIYILQSYNEGFNEELFLTVKIFLFRLFFYFYRSFIVQYLGVS